MKTFYKFPLSFWLLIIILSSNTQSINAQSPDDLPAPRVGVFNCFANNVTDSSITSAELESFSIYIFQALESDTNTQQIDLYSFGNIGYVGKDSLLNVNNDSSFFGTLVPSPDSAIYGTDYYIASSISGKAGNYTLIVSLKDAQTRSTIDSGTASFSSTSNFSIQTAATTAVTSILPLITITRNYQIGLCAASPNLSIDPHLKITPSKNNVDIKETITVSISASDYDGYPLKNYRINLSSTSGSFATQQVQTDENGQATVNYTASDTVGTAVLYAELDSAITVTNDTENVDDESFVVVSKVDSVSTTLYTEKLYQLDFTMSVKNMYVNDAMVETGLGGTTWKQSTSTEVYTANGSVKGLGIFVPFNKSFSFAGDTGKVTGKYFKHSFSFESTTYIDKCWDGLNIDDYTNNGIVDKKKLFQNASIIQMDYNPGNTIGNIYSLNYSIPYNYNHSESSWGVPPGVDGQAQDFNCVRDFGSNPTFSYQLKKSTSQSLTAEDSDPGLSITTVGNEYIFNYTKINIWSDTTTSLTGYTFNATITQVNGILKPFKSSVTSVNDEKLNTAPQLFRLSQNYPNPFNPSTIIQYQIPSASHVEINIFDVMGNEVATLVNDNKAAGTYTTNFNASKLASGVYFYRIEAGSFIQTRKLMLIK